VFVVAGETILIIDDEENIREIITIYLKNEGYNVSTVIDGNQGLNYALSINPE
jgi:DNA-binding response OmpR family regulator